MIKLLVIASLYALQSGHSFAVIDERPDLNVTPHEIRADGTTPTLNISSYRGDHPLVLFFFSEQCGVTFSYKDRLRKLQDDFEPLGFRFLGVRGGKRENPNEPLSIGETNYIKMKFVDDADGQLVRQFKIRQSLTFAVLDAKGVLRYQGAFDDHVAIERVKSNFLRDALRQIAKGKPVTVKTGPALGCAIIPIIPE